MFIRYDPSSDFPLEIFFAHLLLNFLEEKRHSCSLSLLAVRRWNISHCSLQRSFRRAQHMPIQKSPCSHNRQEGKKNLPHLSRVRRHRKNSRRKHRPHLAFTIACESQTATSANFRNVSSELMDHSSCRGMVNNEVGAYWAQAFHCCCRSLMCFGSPVPLLTSMNLAHFVFTYEPTHLFPTW